MLYKGKIREGRVEPVSLNSLSRSLSLSLSAWRASPCISSVCVCVCARACISCVCVFLCVRARARVCVKMSSFLAQLAACILLLCTTIPASPAEARALLASPPPSANLDLLTGISIPAAIAVPSGNEVHVAFKAVGHQHYAFNGTQWVLQNATAKLYGSGSGAVVGRHFYLPQPDANGGQPTWETFDHPHHPTRVSAVTAKGIAAVRVDAASITWNLLQATSHSGNTGEPLGHVTYVQRLKTRKGLPPSVTSGVEKGQTHSSKYSSIYAFYVASM